MANNSQEVRIEGKLVKNQSKNVDNSYRDFKKIKEKIELLEDQKLEENLKKYESILRSEQNINLDLLNFKNQKDSLTRDLKDGEKILFNLELKKSDFILRSQKDSNSSSKEIFKIKDDVILLKKKIVEEEKELSNSSEKIGLLTRDIE